MSIIEDKFPKKSTAVVRLHAFIRQTIIYVDFLAFQVFGIGFKFVKFEPRSVKRNLKKICKSLNYKNAHLKSTSCSKV